MRGAKNSTGRPGAAASGDCGGPTGVSQGPRGLRRASHARVNPRERPARRGFLTAPAACAEPATRRGTFKSVPAGAGGGVGRRGGGAKTAPDGLVQQRVAASATNGSLRMDSVACVEPPQCRGTFKGATVDVGAGKSRAVRTAQEGPRMAPGRPGAALIGGGYTGRLRKDSAACAEPPQRRGTFNNFPAHAGEASSGADGTGGRGKPRAPAAEG